MKSKMLRAPVLATERNRAALASLKARMANAGDFKMQSSIDAIVTLVIGVKP